MTVVEILRSENEAFLWWKVLMQNQVRVYQTIWRTFVIFSELEVLELCYILGDIMGTMMNLVGALISSFVCEATFLDVRVAQWIAIPGAELLILTLLVPSNPIPLP